MITKTCMPADPCVDGRGGASARFLVGGPSRQNPQYLGNDEPALDDLLNDDVLKRLMARDGVGAEQLRQLAGYIPN